MHSAVTLKFVTPDNDNSADTTMIGLLGMQKTKIATGNLYV